MKIFHKIREVARLIRMDKWLSILFFIACISTSLAVLTLDREFSSIVARWIGYHAPVRNRSDAGFPAPCTGKP